MVDTQRTRYERLRDRARSGEVILIDGATGSECFRRGVPEHEVGWSGGAVLTHPETVRAIHADYLDIGAELIATNTFATGCNIMRDVGDEESFEEANRRAVEVAIEARDGAGESGRDAVIAGGISNWSFSGDRPSLEQLHADTVRQATIMRDAGVDLLTLEMMVDIPRLVATLSAASSVGLPVWVGFSIGGEVDNEVESLGEHIELREGGRLSDAVEVVKADGAVDAICIMHTDVVLVERSLATVRASWDGPLGAYGHASAEADDKITHIDVLTPEEYASYVPAWRAAGATILGGCCGIGPTHLRSVADSLI